jgi:hypothetical protein
VLKVELSILKRIAVPIILVLAVSSLFGYIFGGAALGESLVLSIFIFGIPLLFAYYGLRNIKVLIWINIIFALLTPIVSCLGGYRPGLFQLIYTPVDYYAIVVAIISFIGLFVFMMQEEGLLSFLPLAISIATIAASVFCFGIGHRIRMYVFEKRLPQYEEVVRMIDNGTIKIPKQLPPNIEVPEKYKRLSYWVMAEKETRNVLVVTFLWDAGFPCKHSAFVYRSDGEIPERNSDFCRNWPHISRINKYWFKVSD